MSPAPAPRPGDGARTGAAVRLASGILALVFAIVLAGEFLLYVAPARPTAVALSAHAAGATADGGTLVSYTVTGSNPYPIPLRVSAVALRAAPHPRQVGVFYDPGYEPLLASRTSWKGIGDHVAVELGLRGYAGRVEVLDAPALARFVAGPADTALVLASGYVPDVLARDDYAALKGWVSRGGLLFWLGDAFSFYRAGPGQTVVDGDPTVTVGWAGQRDFFGVDLLEGSHHEQARAANPSPLATAFDLRYDWATVGPLLAPLAAHGGTALGWTSTTGDDRTSLALLPFGQGRIVLFGWGVLDDEVTPSRDIATILSADLADLAAPDVATQDVTLGGPGGPGAYSGTFTLPAGAGAAGYVLVALPAGDGQVFHAQTFVPRP
ncbi:MAG TPA: hypothetical protein VFL91_07065 [Thermomicrobiales bacterium]|nr:hypothetical protein [Thermomicrobiales bacterium]